METVQTVCWKCGVSVVATKDDEWPSCEKCEGEWSEVVARRAIMDGQMDHLIPELSEGDEDNG